MYIELLFASLLPARAEVKAVSNGSNAGLSAERPLTRAELLADEKFRKCWEGGAKKPKPPPDCSKKPEPKKPEEASETIDKFVKVDSEALPKAPLEGDMEGMRAAIKNGLDHCKRMDPAGMVTVGGRQFTRKGLCTKAGTKLQELAQKPSSGPDLTYAQFMARVKNAFDFYQYTCPNGDGNVLFTGYYTPAYSGRTKEQGQDAKYRYPIYRKPDDLVVQTSEQTICAGQPGERKVTNRQVRRKLPDGTLVPYYTREEIDNGALGGKGLEIGWVEKRWQVHNAQTQGAMLLIDQYGNSTPLNYGTNNGSDWRGIATAINCLTPGADTGVQGISDWLDAHPREAGAVEALDPSYVFFSANGKPPLGVDDVPMTGRHTVAVDPSYFPYEIPVLFSTQRPSIDDKGKITGKQQFQTLALAQDKGGAIKDCHIDTYWDDKNGGITAGNMKNRGSVFVAIPKNI